MFHVTFMLLSTAQPKEPLNNFKFNFLAVICIIVNYMLNLEPDKNYYSCLAMQCILFRNNQVFQMYLGISHLVLLLCDWVRWADWTRGMYGVTEAHTHRDRWTDGQVEKWMWTDVLRSPQSLQGKAGAHWDWLGFVEWPTRSLVHRVGGWLAVCKQKWFSEYIRVTSTFK